MEDRWEDPLTAAGKGRDLRGPTPILTVFKTFPLLSALGLETSRLSGKTTYLQVLSLSRVM